MQLNRWEDYAEFLIVRSSQFSDYQKLYGSTHVIASMPDSMNAPQERGICMSCEVKDGGIGYSRLFVQLLANYLNLPAVWMLDDFNLVCWKLTCSALQCNEDNVSMHPASFAEVMIHIESLFQEHTWERSYYPNMEQQAAKAMELSEKSTIQDVTGSFDQYGVVGLCRGRQWRKQISNPIKRTYSVYSFFC